MNALRTSDELETLKSDLRALRSDLREVARDVGDLTGHMTRNLRQTPVRNWLGWAGSRFGSRDDLDDTLAEWRERGERSAAALRSTMQEHPAATVVGALAVGLALAWFLSRSSDR